MMNTKKPIKKTLATAVRMAVVIGLGTCGNVQATAIAFAVNQITNFTITSSTTYTTIGAPSQTTFNSAAYTGPAILPVPSTTQTALLPLATNAAQAKVSNNRGPNGNVYTFLAGTNAGMVGSRGDSNTSAGSPFTALFPGMGISNINNVAEARVLTGSGRAGSSSGNNTSQATIQINLANTGTISFTYRDRYRYYATTSVFGETAQGTISNLFTIANAAGVIVFNDNFAPINISCASNSGLPSPCDSGVRDTGIRTATSGILTGGNYTISLASSSLAVAASAIVPEPGSILLFSLGLGAIGFTVRRKQKMG